MLRRLHALRSSQRVLELCSNRVFRHEQLQQLHLSDNLHPVHRHAGTALLEGARLWVRLSSGVLRRRLERRLSGLPDAVLRVRNEHNVYHLQGREPLRRELFVPRRVLERRPRQRLHENQLLQ